MVKGIEVKTMNDVLKLLNSTFPSPVVPTVKNYERTTTQEDPKFYAYKSSHINSWWIVCTDYYVFRDNSDELDNCAAYFTQQTGVECMPCHQHPVAVATHQGDFRAKKGGVEAFLGRCSYTT